MSTTSSKGLKALQRFLPYYAKYKYVLLLDLFCAALTSICDLVLPMIIRFLTNAALGKAATFGPLAASGTAGGVNNTAGIAIGLTLQTVVTLGALYLLLRIIDAVAAFYMAYTGHVMGVYIETDMRQDAFDHLARLSDRYYANTKIGQIMSRITGDLFDVTEFAHHCPEEFFIAALKAVVAFIILVRINVLLTLIIFALLPLMVISCTYFNLKVRAAFRRQRVNIGELNASLEDSLLGNRVVRAFANEELEQNKFRAGNQEFMRIKKNTYKYMAAFQETIRIFDGLMYVAVIVAGGYFLVQGAISSGDFVAYIMYVTTMLATIRRIIEFAEQFQRGMTGVERFLEIMDEDVEIKDIPGAQPLQITAGAISFQHVSFTYPDDQDSNVLMDISLDIQPGEKLALVGPSGGGKTTFCNLIPRFYDTNAGQILIDGQDIRTITLKSLRSSIGIVQQDVYLFSGSISENIGYGKPGATREEIMEAARLADADEFISKLPQGYDTYVGERGVKLSGGQKQRVAIARVFLKNPPILLLDEATSALDNEAERLIGKSLEKLAHGRTTLTIAHRLTTIKDADRIFELSGHSIRQVTYAEITERDLEASEA